MFQNENVIEKNNDKLNIFSNVFALKNVVLYIISFLLSMVGLGGEFSVFSISMLGACFASSVPTLGIILVSLIGNFIRYGIGGALGYFLTALVLVATLFIVKPIYNEKERNEKIKIGKNVFLSILIIQIIKFAISGFRIFEILCGLCICFFGVVLCVLLFFFWLYH